ncbi:hypothetical protein N324_07798, partial [Chlamydotis macqueenii]
LLLSFFFDAEVAGLSRRLQVVLRLLRGPRVAGMDFLVAIQRLLVAEVLAADGALGGGLGGLLVQDEAHLQAEALLALRAGVGPLHHVVHLVPHEAVLESR